MEHLDFIKSNIERIEESLSKNTELTQQVLVQATKTNGRVNNLESRFDRAIKVFWFIVGSTVTILGYAIQHYMNLSK
jgi:hypothetical protein